MVFILEKIFFILLVSLKKISIVCYNMKNLKYPIHILLTKIKLIESKSKFHKNCCSLFIRINAIKRIDRRAQSALMNAS
jgi:hypothetical protein